jgi:histidinol-phosphatase (PHP family)
VLDYHLHLWPHGTPASQPTLDELAAYCETAAGAGVGEIALTEHLFRFRQADAVLAGFWDDDPNPDLRASLARYWKEHAHADLDAYVEAVLEAKAAGLPVILGLEVDHYAGRMDKVAALLDGYPFDVLLGSVHWVGAWGFDQLGDPVIDAEWNSRSIESVWDAYTEALEELAASGMCDVLAHPDLAKVSGRRPAVPDEWYDRMAEAAAASGMAAEVSSAGWRKPAAEAYPAPALLSRFRKAGVPATTASDSHGLGDVASRSSDLKALLADAGYETLTSFRGRTATQVPV